MGIAARCGVTSERHIIAYGFVVGYTALLPLCGLLRVCHNGIDECGHFAEEFAVGFLCRRGRIEVILRRIRLLSAVSDAIDDRRVFTHLAVADGIVLIACFCHVFVKMYIYT